MAEAGGGRRGRLRWLLGGFLLLVLLAAAFGGGVVVGDDGDEVAQLKRSVASTERDRDEARDDLGDAQDESASLTDANAKLSDDNDRLEDRLKAELNLKGSTSSPKTSSGSAPAADLSLGEAATVGGFTLKPTAVESLGSGRVRATVTVKNDGDASESPLCGGGAQLLDRQGRSFDGDAVIGKGDACDDLQPGLTGTIYIDFTTPEDAKPAALELTPDILGDGPTERWGT